MTLCFVDPADAIRAIADSVGREARRQLLGEAVRAWVDETLLEPERKRPLIRRLVVLLGLPVGIFGLDAVADRDQRAERLCFRRARRRPQRHIHLEIAASRS